MERLAERRLRRYRVMNHSGVGLRAYRDSDFAFLVSLREETMRPHILNSGTPYDESAQLERVRYRLDCAQIITKGGEDVGLFKIVRDSNPWELVQIQLRPDTQGTGIGTTIITALLAEARDAQVNVSLVVPKASPARRLYERLGFRVVNVRDHAYEMQYNPMPASR